MKTAKGKPAGEKGKLLSEGNGCRTFDHLFRIYPIHSVFLKEAIIVNFEGRQQFCQNENQTAGQTKSCAQRKYLSITPTFNRDYKHYTSSFILPEEEEESDDDMKKHHENKVLDSQREIEAADILVPKPKSKNQYCAVCHSHYEDYLTHIHAPQHKKNIKKSRFNQHIQCITLFISEQLSKEKDRVMTRSAKRKGDHLWVDYELEDKTNKKRKGEVASKARRNTQEREQDYQTHFSKRSILETTGKQLYKELD